jgi:hypothetical protein
MDDALTVVVSATVGRVQVVENELHVLVGVLLVISGKIAIGGLRGQQL